MGPYLMSLDIKEIDCSRGKSMVQNMQVWFNSSKCLFQKSWDAAAQKEPAFSQMYSITEEFSAFVSQL